MHRPANSKITGNGDPYDKKRTLNPHIPKAPFTSQGKAKKGLRKGDVGAESA